MHFLERDELAGLKRLQKEQEPKAAYVFVNERGQPFGRMGIARMIERAGELAKIAFPLHVHMLRHSTGFALAAKGMDTPPVATLPRPRFDHQHRALYGHEPGAVQKHLALRLRDSIRALFLP